MKKLFGPVLVLAVTAALAAPVAAHFPMHPKLPDREEICRVIPALKACQQR